ncbi:hypothetical protein FACS189493_2980 [Spirochaetia bacterium]|nr:hypothetical protein FACS189493_2980 [Spirochaetia bacterium]
MDFSPGKTDPVFLMILKRGTLFFFLMSLLSALLYGLGTVKHFTDPTQALLLGLTAFFGLLLAIIAVYGIIPDLALLFRHGGLLRIPALVVRLGMGAAGIILACAAVFILVTAGGNRG